MKSILISIRPEWVAKILNGEKILEIRKSKPQCELPIDVYIYCTKEQGLIYEDTHINGEYQDFRYYCVPKSVEEQSEYKGSGKVVARFCLKKVEKFEYETCSRDISGYWLENGEPLNLKPSCLTYEEMFNYIKSGVGYAWHIDNLEIFDNPRELGEFEYLKKFQYEENMHPCPRNRYETWYEKRPLTKAPNSWCYIER